jgi:nucleoside-diphosphate-sugar epimerase
MAKSAKPMRVFMTGASGYIGSAVVRELLVAGHEVIGLARSDESAKVIERAGGETYLGNLEDLDGLRKGAASADGVIHLAFNHQEMRAGKFANAIKTDLQAIQTMGKALTGTDKPFIIVSGTLTLASLGRVGTEEDVPASDNPRIESENITIALAEHGVRSSVVRLSPSVHSDADKHGFITSLIGMARAKGVSAYVGDGSNRWPAVHRQDAARLFLLALESAKPGMRLHGVGEEGIPFKQIAQTIGDQLKLPTVSITKEAAMDNFGFLTDFVQLDNPTSNALTKEWLAWNPEGPKLIADMEEGHYFSE